MFFPHEETIPLTDLSWLERGTQFPPASEEPRMLRYARNRQLWKGQHSEVLGDFYKILREDKKALFEVVVNWHKRLSLLWADLMLSESPRFLDGEDANQAAGGEELDSPAKAAKPSDPPDATEAMTPPEPPQKDPAAIERQQHIDRLVGKDDNAYVNTLYKLSLDRSRYGDALLKITLGEEGAQFWAQPPHYWFPIVDPNNLAVFTSHVLAWTFKQGKDTFLRVEIHEKGLIQHRVYQLEGNFIGEELPIGNFDPRVPTGIEYTKIDDFLVVPFPGLVPSDEIFGEDDYNDINSLVQALEQRASQINKILDKHSDPSMYGPSDQLETDEDGNTVFRAADRYFEVDPGDDPPGYVVWEAQLEYAFKEMETILHQLYIISETSPAAFGQIESGLAESGSALRRLMLAPLAKVARITMTFDPSAKRAIKIAAELERAHGHDTPEIPSVNIQWQDGLPADPKEQAEVEQIRTGNKPTTSVTSAIRRIDGGTQEEAEAEKQRMEEEAQAESARLLTEANAQAEIAATHAPEKPPTSKTTSP